MEVKTQIEKLREEYQGKSCELEALKQEHAELDKKEREKNIKKTKLNDEIEDLDEKLTDKTNELRKNEKEYIYSKEGKLVKTSLLIATIIGTLVLRLPFIVESNLITIMCNALITSAIYCIADAIIVGTVVLGDKLRNRFLEQYRKTEEYTKQNEIIEDIVKKITELKNIKKSLDNTDNLYKNISELNKQIKVKEEELEEIKKQIFELLVGNNNKIEVKESTEEKISPLTKTKKRGN